MNVHVGIVLYDVRRNTCHQSDYHALENERCCDKRIRRSDIAHDHDFLSAREYSKLDGIDNYEHADNDKNNKEPHKHEYDARADIFDGVRYLDLTVSDYNLTAPVGSDDLALTASVLSTNTTRIRVEATEDLEQGAEIYVYLYNAEDMENAIQYGLITEENRSVLFENLTSARVYRVGIGVKESSAQVSVDISDDSGPDRSLGLNQK